MREEPITQPGELRSPALVLDKLNAKVRLYDEEGRELSSPGATASKYPIACLFGAGIVGGQIWRPGAVEESSIPFARTSEMVDWWEAQARGAICLFVVWGDGRFLIAPDPVGAAPVYYYESSALLIVSASIPSLTAIARTYGVALKQSIGFALEVGLLGNGGIHEASFESVRRSEPFVYMFGDVQTWSLRDYSLAADIFDITHPIDDLAACYRDQTLNAMNVVLDSTYSARKIMNLTGGLDSRVLLSALSHLNRTEEIEFYTSGAEGTRDVDIADGLSRVLGLRRTSGSGLGGMAQSLGPGDSPRLAMRRTGGLSRQGCTGLELGENSVVVGGLYGMFTHSNVSDRVGHYARSKVDPWRLARSMYPGAAFDEFSASRSLFTREYQAELVALFEKQIQRAEARVPVDDFVFDYLFLNSRNRFHSGIIQASASSFTARIDPLYSVDALRLGVATPAKLRNTNIHQVDAISHWAPGLLALPFDSDKFSGPIRDLRRFPSSRPFGDVIASGYEKPTKQFGQPARASQVPDPRRTENVRIAQEINAPYWQVRMYSEEASTVSSVLRDRDLGLADYLNVQGISWIIQNALRNKAYLRVFIDLVATLEWLTGTPRRS